MANEPALGTCIWCGIECEWEQLWWMEVVWRFEKEEQNDKWLCCSVCWDDAARAMTHSEPTAQIFCRVP